MDFQIIDVDQHSRTEGLAIPHPYDSLPVLVERDLILYESNIINEYIDDRFPHPRLMPTEPALRARTRLSLFGFEQELFCHIHAVKEGTPKIAAQARAAIRDALTVIAPALAKQQYLLGDEYSILDVAIAPLLWRLEHYEIQLPKEAEPLHKYAERLFSRPAFIHATTASEKAMRN
jgi:RNA polymerase-associated protein